MSQNFSSISKTWGSKVWAKDPEFAYDIVRYANLSGNESALYVGIGTGELAGKFNVSELWGLDISKEMMEECKTIPRQRLIVGDANNIPFLDDTFDLVFSRNLLKHVEDPKNVISEMKRVTKPGGKVFTVESCVINKKDAEYPNRCVRTIEPNHYSFRTHKYYVNIYNRLMFSSLEDIVYKYKSMWLSKWIQSNDANEMIRDKILAIYQSADNGFKKRQEVEIFDNEIRSIIYWSFIIGVK